MKWFASFILVLALQFSLAAGAEEKAQPKKAKEILYKVVVRDKNNKNFKIALTEYQNHNDELEVRIEAAGIPRFASKINPVLGFGRDLDDNGKIDTWFFISDNGMDSIQLEGNDRLGRDVLGELLEKKYRSSLMMYVTSASSSIFSYLLISVSSSVDVTEEFYRDWMDLEQSRIQFQDDLENLRFGANWQQYSFNNELISIGFKELANRMDRFATQDYWGYTFADVGIWITGGVVLNWGAKILSKLGVIASETAFVTSVKKTFFSFFEKQKALIENRLSTMKSALNTKKVELGVKVAQKEVTAALTVATWKMALNQTIKSQRVKRKLALYIGKTIKLPKDVLKGAKSEWQYIGLNLGMQLGSEAYARYDQIHDANPAIMAKNLLTNPDVIQNVGFMTTDTILMTGLSKNFKTTKAKFLASGAVALTNSSIMNFAIKSQDNIPRVAFDVSWEAIIGNGQVQFDLMVLEKFEKMALKKNNPKIKLVGYAITLVDMGVGYIVYSKASSAMDKVNEKVHKPKEPQVMLVPILVETN